MDSARQQLQSKVQKNAVYARKLFQPDSSKAGWIKLMRQALGLSGAQLARKMKVTRALVSNTEKVETEGRVTLKKMHEFAEAMDCEFVYCMIPKEKIETIAKKRVAAEAQAMVNKENGPMDLEGLASEILKNEIPRVRSDQQE